MLQGKRTQDYDKFSSGIFVVGLDFDLPFLLPWETKGILHTANKQD